MKPSPAIQKSPLTLVNNALRRAGLPYRLVRGRGYYYVTGVAVSSGLYAMWLERTEADLDYARTHVNAVLAEEGVHFHINKALQCVQHGVGYTGYLRSCTNVAAPMTVEQWQQSLGH